MPQAVTHILVPILIASLVRDYVLSKNTKAHFPLHYVFIAGLGGVLPDIDIALSLILNIFGVSDWWIHKTFTHSLFFPLVLFFGFIIFRHAHVKAKICNIGRHNLKLSLILLMLSFGVLTHIGLDLLAGEQAYLFYPLSMYDYGINLFSLIPLSVNLSSALLDGILLVVWLSYLELKHKISDYI